MKRSFYRLILQKKSIFFPLLISLLFAVSVSFSACTFLKNQNARIELTIDSAIVNQIINTANDYAKKNDVTVKNMYLDISIDGDYQEKRTVKLEHNAKIIFEDIPVDSVIYLVVSVYSFKQNDAGVQTRIEFYNEKSVEFTIKEGINEIILSLRKTSFITVSVKIIDDIKLSYSMDGTKLIFTVDGVEKADDVVWFLDGEIQTQNTKTFILETKRLRSGTYELEVICGQNSAAAFITIQ